MDSLVFSEGGPAAGRPCPSASGVGAIYAYLEWMRSTKPPWLGRREFALVALALVSGRPLVAEERKMSLANGLRAVKFERSGGLFFLVLGGQVTFEDASGTVKSEMGDRSLSVAERAIFAALDLDRARLVKAPFSSAGADTYQWDLVLDCISGDPVSLRWFAAGPPDSGLNAKVPGLGAVAGWVGAEVDRIWSSRATARP